MFFLLLLRSEHEEYIEGSMNSQIHHLYPKCIAIKQSALRLFLPECIAPQTARGYQTVFRVDSRDKGLIVVMFCSDLPVKRCEGDRA